VSDDWTPLLNGIPAPGNTFVLPRHQMVYVSVTKVACTTLRWMVADLAGEDLEGFYTAHAPHQTRLMTIHRPRQDWQHTPQLFQVPEEERASMSRDNGWLVFAVVRDPWSRLFSAWQSKFLVRHPYYLRHYGGEPWFPRVPERPEDVLDDFARFVFTAPWLTHPRLCEDVHFLPQVRSVQPLGINYSKVYDLRELAELFEDIHSHLRRLGMDQELYLPRANETPLPMIREVLDHGVAEEIEKLYEADFDVYGSRWDLATLKYAPMWSRDAIGHAAYHTVANERINDISRQARRLEASLRREQRRNHRLRTKLAARQPQPQPTPQPPPDGIAARLRRRTRSALLRLGRPPGATAGTH
jgi:hypothetical protein